ncbi:MAG: acyltransferase family protein [Gammaproteobacteria bacterium]
MTSKSPGRAFRPEIEGLRAVAATLVAVFHIWLGRVSGGVDVFFVVSSFLITTGLLGQIERSGTIDFARFWGRLVKRLAPAALLVLCAVVIASLFWLPQSRWKETIQGVAAAAVYLENWLLAHDSVDYLAQNRPPSPVTHYWALSIQGQFYVVWPFLFAATAYVARRSNVAFRKVLVPALAVLFAASLGYSVYITGVNQPYAYFHTFARMWEFCIGALLAVLIPALVLPNSVRLAAGWVGLLAIVSCGFLFQVSRVFPGYAALWPTLAGALVIIAGTTRGFGADKLLATRPMVYLGSISYGIYLWHFPILAFCKTYAEPHPISFITGVCILAAAVGLAALTKHFVESPKGAADPAKESTAASFRLGTAWLAPVIVGLGIWGVYYKHLREHANDHELTARGSHPGALALTPGFVPSEKYRAPAYPGPLAVSDNRDRYDDENCSPRIDATVPKHCILGSANGKVVIAVVGSSHSSQWLPALQQIAVKENWKVVSFARSNCPFHLGQNVGEKELPTCKEWNENVLKALLELQPDAVFMTSTRTSDGDEFVPEGYLETWRALDKGGVKVIALRDNPNMWFDASACVELHGPNAPVCSLERAAMLEVPSPTQVMKDPPANVRFIDLSDYFCDNRACRPVIGNVVVYRHFNHITSTYALTLAPMLTRELHRGLGIAVPAPAPGTLQAGLASGK